ncbi:acetyl-CoA carboxylase biotin carboxyl carrier protein [Pararhodobacter aggregans]|uniref:Biotin carboxyl carrier protein of acetyl-CoA carboxylase n=1 Tax=Pararhodobacter aggregans TaxID=404875 RepID=A0A2T7UUW5_9RHOB|nr:biotin/lipoyl-containing protein [Pararhodobacter aggregans]PTX03966.1 biotin carboxyl carrier protein [Pararhodobacter aggregans]PVE48560.1 acetyl-CoA carboxylase biotin carboxyl carrier protein [Pararhodobacter aggregans]
MAGTADFLTDADLTRIERLMEALDRSGVDYMKVDFGELQLTLGKGAPLAPRTPPVSAPAPAPAAAVRAAPAPAPAPAPTASGEVIAAPLMGRYYAKPEQGAAPFVQVGDMVTKDTTICLIEVMKTFTSVPAGMAGRVVEVLVADEAVVEYGQPLFRIEKA